MNGHRVPVIAIVIASIFLACALSAPAIAQRRQASPSTAFAPSPKAVLGFEPGDDRTIADWRQITDYFSRLDKASDRVLVETFGESTLKRPLIVAYISARENILALNKYKEIQRKLADPRLIATELERDRLQRDARTVITISCSIHSTEIIASQMSMRLAYDLATAQDVETREILQNTIILLIPSPNPDGIDIVANWYRKTLGTPFEGKDPPEIYHHYAGHDDNRDWYMLNLAETRAVTRLLWGEWFPEIVYDVHQQGSNGSRFFVPPFFDPPNPRIAPLLLRQVGLIGHKMAADLQDHDQKGVLTNALYDTWWHGGFRTAPYFHNSIGILTEASSARLMTPSTVTREQLARGGTRGLRSALESSTNFPDPWPGGTWRPQNIMEMELSAARSLLSMATKYRSTYVSNFYNLNWKSINENIAAGDPVAYLIPAGQGNDEPVARMLTALIQQGIEVYRLDKELHLAYGPQVLQRTNPAKEKLGEYRTLISASNTAHEVPAGSYIIFLQQPQRANVLALFEPQIYPNRVGATGEAERPYDVTGWTLPMQMGVDAPSVIKIGETSAERRLTLIRDPNEVRRNLGLEPATGNQSPTKNPIRQAVRIGIYKSSMANIDEGWTRFVFDTCNVPYKSISDVEIRQGSLTRNFDVIVLPSQRARDIVEGNAPESYPSEFVGGITPTGVANLKRFVEDGGMMICFDASCELAIKNLGVAITNVLEGAKSSDFYCPGSILSLQVDTRSPLARSFAQSVDAYFISSEAFETNDSRVRVIARYADRDVLRSGWLLGEDRLRGKIALAEAPLGKGQVVLFAFRPQHRGQTWGTIAFIWNAINSWVSS